MSFVKKGLKKVWGFVKKHWLKIVIVAAIVFTAGVASVGFAAFSGVSTVGGFFGAVGSFDASEAGDLSPDGRSPFGRFGRVSGRSSRCMS